MNTTSALRKLGLLVVTSAVFTWGVAALSGQAGATNYTITDLGTLGGTYSFGYSVNDAGQVAGMTYLPVQGIGAY